MFTENETLSIQTLKSIYELVKGGVQIRWGGFEWTEGIKHEDNLSQLLLIVVLNELMMRTSTKIEELRRIIRYTK